MADEVNTGAPVVDTPNTATPSENTSGITTPTTPTTDTATNQAQTTATETKPTTDTPKDELPKGVKRELWELRKARRESEEKIRELESKLSATPTNTPTAQTTAEIPADLLDDPEKWAQAVIAKAKTEAKTEILTEQQQAAEKARIDKETQEGLDFILTQDELAKSGDYTTAVEALLRTPELAYISQKYPKIAAERAVELYKAQKGINATRQATAKTNASATATTNASVTTVSGKKIWTRAEVEKYLDYTHPDFEKRKTEIHDAFYEGRVK